MEFAIFFVIGVIVGGILVYFIKKNNPDLEAKIRAQYAEKLKQAQEELAKLKSKIGG